MNTMLIIIIIFSSHLLMMTIPTAFSDATNDITGDRYIDHICSSTSANYTPPDSNYWQSMTLLIDDLLTNAPKNNGFRNASWAVDDADTAYGLALCRGDVSMNDCGDCLHKATREVVNTDCLNNQSAITWHDHCMLKYSDKPFFGKIDNENRFHLCNDTQPPGDWLWTFRHKAQSLLNGLVDEAAKNAIVPLFANGSTTYGNQTLYAMVQCTRDLSVGDCTTCLNSTITDDDNNCLPYVGGTVVSGSCMMRYELYPFLN